MSPLILDAGASHSLVKTHGYICAIGRHPPSNIEVEGSEARSCVFYSFPTPEQGVHTCDGIESHFVDQGSPPSK